VKNNCVGGCRWQENYNENMMVKFQLQCIDDAILNKDKTMIWISRHESWTDNINLDWEHEYLVKTILILIIRSMNKIWIQLVLMRVRANVPQFSIYTLDSYSTLVATQAIFKVMAWASSYLACTPSCLKIVLCDPRHL
jgi:hypothetical protein